MKVNAYNYTSKKKIIIFDFDGVIKETVDVKGHAFQKLFFKNKKLQEKIMHYHKKYNGINREKKIKKFIQWSGEDMKNLDFYLRKFSSIVVQEVLKSKWVSGVKKFLYLNRGKQLYLLTATPHDEIIIILKKLEILKCFKKVYGFPQKKPQVVKEITKINLISKKDIVLIGDSYTDYEAAVKNDISFLLRKTENNKTLHKQNIKYINNFI